MDADVPVVPISVVDDVLPTLGEAARRSRRADAAARRTLVALGFGTFVAALVFIVPPIFFPQMAAELARERAAPGADHDGHAGAQRGARAGLRSARPIAPATAGSFSSGWSRRPFACSSLGSPPTFLLLLLASVAGAVTDAGVLGPSFAVAGTAFSGTAARRAIGWTQAAQSGSAIVGVPVLAAVGAAAGWRVAFVVGGAGGARRCGPGNRVVAPGSSPRPRSRCASDALLAPYRPLLRDGSMRRLYGATMLGAVCWIGMLTYLGAFLAEALGLGTGHVGLVYMGAGAGYCLGSLAVGGPLARIQRALVGRLGYLAGAVLIALAFSARVGTAGAVVAVAGASLMMGVEGVAMTAVLTAETPSGAGTTMTLSGSLFNLGAAGGGAIGGLLLALSGYEALAIGLPVFALGAALLSLAVSAGSPRQQPVKGQDERARRMTADSRVGTWRLGPFMEATRRHPRRCERRRAGR